MNADLMRGHRILVVEDSIILGRFFRDVLESAGAEIVGPAATLDDARALAAENRLSAALLDVLLNGKEVWPAAQVLAKKGVPFAFCTGHVDRSSIPQEWSHRPILIKPAPPQQIIYAVFNLLNQFDDELAEGAS